MRFLNELPEYFLGCDPDSRNMAYAVVDQKGTVIEAWTVDHKSDPLDQTRKHLQCNQEFLGDFVAVVEGQRVYKDVKGSNPDSLLTLARASGVACSWIASKGACRDIVIALPQEWKGSKGKAGHQHHIWTSIGEHPRIHGKGKNAYCCPSEYRGMKPTKLKHIADAIGLALWLKDQYMWHFKKKRLTK
jgi:hypothetical protein